MARMTKISLLALALLVGLAACSGTPAQSTGSTEPADSSETTVADGTPSSDDVLVVAYNDEPITLDPTTTSRTATRDPSKLIYEGLLTIDSEWVPRPLLAESYTISDDRLTYTFKLREGVLFHNGDEMKASDVVASMERWSGLAGVARDLAEPEWTENGDYEVQLTLAEPSFVALHALSTQSQTAVIMPAALAESAGAESPDEYIGTGPFKLAEWRPNDGITFARNDSYQPPSETWDGLAGPREPKFEEIHWLFVGDAATRVSGLQSGEYDIAIPVPLDQVPTLQDTPGLTVETYDIGLLELIFNKKEGPMASLEMREIVNKAIDPQNVLAGAFVGPDFFELSPAFFPADNVQWHTDAGAEVHADYDPDGARTQLESLQPGQPVTILASRDSQNTHSAAIVLQQELASVGFDAQIDAVDAATWSERRQDPAAWDIFFTSASFGPIPSHFIEISNPEFPGWTDDAQITELFREISRSESEAEALEFMTQLQARVWETKVTLPLGHTRDALAYRDDLQGFEYNVSPIFFGASLGSS